jgi:hypothetical protein
MGLRRQEGEFDILYWSLFEPTTGTNPKEDPANYSRLGFVGDLSDEISNETQSTLDRASTQHESVIYGQQSSSVSITANVQKTRDEGGSVTSSPTASSGTAGDKSLTINTGTGDAIDVSTGDMIALGSHDYWYRIDGSLNLGNSASGSIDIEPRLQADIGGGNTVSLVTKREDPVQRVVRDAAVSQSTAWFLVYPEDGSGNAQTGLEAEHGFGVLESITNTRNAGEFKQFEIEMTSKIAPDFFTV